MSYVKCLDEANGSLTEALNLILNVSNDQVGWSQKLHEGESAVESNMHDKIDCFLIECKRLECKFQSIEPEDGKGRVRKEIELLEKEIELKDKLMARICKDLEKWT
uniref:Uncharacterized protein n=1 Tax=Mucochytrium quahogii TaxID=96639 RepID=A0A7S2WJ37_9STRA|mmetsp:Transcript_24767/g.53415  ORF Transcript_24767/g.53415 Transcript_24767/m.53415 type:complete len:106 (+) Transcript_24767:3-320(+)